MQIKKILSYLTLAIMTITIQGVALAGGGLGGDPGNPPGTQPQIQFLTDQATTNTSHSYTWDTDIPTTATVYVDDVTIPIVSDFPAIREDDNIISTHHEIIINGLLPATEYSAYIYAYSEDGGYAYEQRSFHTDESSNITNMTTTRPFDGAINISWTTDVPSNSTVVWWEEPYMFGGTANEYTDNSMSINHSIQIYPGLSQNILYAYRIKSEENGNIYLSDVHYFNVGDTEAPTGTMVINGGAEFTNDLNRRVSLDITYDDNISSWNEIEMRTSNDGINYDPWEQALDWKNWYLTPGDGIKTVYIQFRDGSGNLSPTLSDTIILDNTKPVLTEPSVVTPANNKRPTITWSANDSNGIDAYWVFVGTNPDGTDILPAYITNDTSYTFAQDLSDGTYYVRVWARDNGGNMVYSQNIPFTIDTQAPTGSVIMDNDSDYTDSIIVSLTVAASDNNTVTEMRTSRDGVSFGPWFDYKETGWSWFIGMNGDGVKDIYVQLRDTAGNESAVFHDDIILDTKAPTGSININGQYNSTVSSQVTLYLTAEDTGSGVVDMSISDDGLTWSNWMPYQDTYIWTMANCTASGFYNVYVKYRDASGKVSQIYSDKIYYLHPWWLDW